VSARAGFVLAHPRGEGAAQRIDSKRIVSTTPRATTPPSGT